MAGASVRIRRSRVSGGQATLDEAREAAAEAIAYALEGQPVLDQGDQVEYHDIAVG